MKKTVFTLVVVLLNLGLLYSQEKTELTKRFATEKNYNLINAQLKENEVIVMTKSQILANELNEETPLPFDFERNEINSFEEEKTYVEQKSQILNDFLQRIDLSTFIDSKYSGSTKESDSLALVALYNATNGINWTNKINWLSGPVYTWYGITVESDSCVSRISLSSNNLSGSIPDQFFELDSLRELILMSNSLEGELDTLIKNFSKLEILSLSSNSFTGEIPSVVYDLSDLRILSLSSNFFDGSISPEIGNLNKLYSLSLSNNDLSGEIPSEIDALDLLQYLGLDDNSLSGEIPLELYNLASLVTIDLENNDLTGSINSNIGNLPFLSYLNLSGNSFNGELPSNLFDLSNMQYLYIENNNFTGSLPDFNQPISLEYFRASNNSFNGDLPSGWDYASNLKNLTISNAGLTGSIPASIGSLSNLEYMYLDQNFLSGSIPEEFCNLTKLKYLTLSYNALTGEIPENVGNLSSIFRFEVTNNLLSGNIPSNFGMLKDLAYLELSYNNLSGTIPVELGAMDNLYYLLLDGNKLNGEIPSELGSLSRLYKLYLNNNDLSGTIPSELGNLSGLRYLILTFNELTGEIPSEIGNLSNLLYLYLSGNKLSGNIPESLGSLSKLYYLLLNNNELAGTIPTTFENLHQLTYLSLSNNNLEGDIPDEIGNLLKLQNFYIRNNNFSGNIPSSIGLLPVLDRIAIEFNDFNFGNLESANFHSSYSLFKYAPQDEIYLYSNQNGSTIDLYVSDNGSNNVYQWYNQEIKLVNEINDTLTITTDSTGFYYCVVRNDDFIELELTSDAYAQNLVVSHGVLKEDYDALVEFYNAMDGNSWTDNTNWLSDEKVKDWYGIYVVGGRVAVIDLWRNNLSGELPEILTTLTGLKDLSLTANNIEGEIPSWISRMNWLKSLSLGVNRLTGPIPGFLEDLTDLEWLSLSFNRLIGPIPEEIGNIKNLKSLHIGYNNLNCTIPASIGNLDSLKYLTIYSGGLIGPIPPEIGNLQSVENIDLAYNEFNSELPEEIGNLSNLQSLRFDRSQLTGEIPNSICNLTNLTSLQLSQNHLIGNIPQNIGDLTELFNLELYKNHLTGQIPNSINNIQFAHQIRLGRNNLRGDLPNISTLNPSTYFYVNDNYFDFGNLDSANINWSDKGSTLYAPQGSLEIDSSFIGGKIVLEAICKGYDNAYQWYNTGSEIKDSTRNTIYIDPLNDGIYYCKVNNPRYNDLTIESKAIGVNIPMAGGVIKQDHDALIELFDSTNGHNWKDNYNWCTDSLVEEWYGIDVSEGRVTNLSLYDNNLCGSLPDAIGDLTEIVEIWFAKDSLMGQIPSTIGNLTKLKKFYCSYNQLSGSLPMSFSDLDSLKQVWFTDNSLDSLVDLSSMQNFEDFYISGNKLTFKDLEDANVSIKSYSNQDSLEIIVDGYTVTETNSFSLDIKDIAVEKIWSVNNEYFWQHDDDTLTVSSIDADLFLYSFSESDTGLYYCKVINENFPALTLVSKPIRIGIQYVPKGIELIPNDVDENVATNSTVCSLSTIHGDENASFVYTFKNGNGFNDADNEKFTIDVDVLKIKESPDFEVKSIYYIYLQTEDQNGETFEGAVEVVVNNLNDNSPVLSDHTFSIEENSPNSTLVGTVTATDLDGELDTILYSITAGNTNEAFSINSLSGEILVNNSSALDYETISSFSLTVNASDGLHSDQSAITINLTDVVDTGVEELFTNIKVYPNPTDELLKIDVNMDNDDLNYELLDESGSLLRGGSFSANTQLDVQDIPSGIYILRISSGSDHIVKKVIIK